MSIAGEALRNSNSCHLRTTLLCGGGAGCKRILSYFRFMFAVQVLAFATPLFAQANNGVIRGTVVDPTGAVIPKATVKITKPDGHAVTSATSDAAGLYQARNLLPEPTS